MVCCQSISQWMAKCHIDKRNSLPSVGCDAKDLWDTLHIKFSQVIKSKVMQLQQELAKSGIVKLLLLFSLPLSSLWSRKRMWEAFLRKCGQINQKITQKTKMNKKGLPHSTLQNHLKVI